MQERLDVITLQPRQWLHWAPLKGGRAAHALVRGHYPQAEAWALEPGLPPARAAGLAEALDAPAAAAEASSGWLQRTWSRLRGPHTHTEAPQPGSMDMLWANMALHMAADPQALLARWRELLAVDGFVMFSALGPDTLRELRDLYARLGWPAPTHTYTDMHDWGDMLVGAGFAEPVMDMERITLTFATPERALQELRELGRNLAVDRDGVTHGRAWLGRLHEGLRSLERNGSIALTFEIIYGHALQPSPRAGADGTTAIGLDQMRRMLRRHRP